ncbi:MAG: MBOAT family O-acyltransferase [Candidatus Omnitrophota bacterium]
MLFNSLQFAAFFVIVYSLYLRFNHKWQNRLLLIASYVFYGSWDWRFLSLIFISTVLDYFCGIKIYESNNRIQRKRFLIFSIIGNLTILGFFKYFNFFTSNLQNLLGFFGFSIGANFINIILPVGISFYTFQTMSYTIDIYRKEMVPTKKFLDFALFVAFFPQLVAGPIERAKHLLPQVLSPRQLTLDKFGEGCYLIFWGLFQKVFIADNLAKIVDPVFAGGAPYNGSEVLIALYAFSFQIFCDFAGYSNIARGLGKCMGFDLMINFNLPYFSVNPSEFWKRWHISLSSWLRDYIYIPLGGNKKGIIRTYANLLTTMLLGGLWHGASWTFVVWGAYHAILLIIHRLFRVYLQKFHLSDFFEKDRTWFFIRVIFFFNVVCLGWLIFRAGSMSQIFQMLQALFFNFHFIYYAELGCMLFILWILLIVQLIQYWKNDLLIILKSALPIRVLFYCVCFYLLVIFGVTGAKEFVYFQF